MTAKLVKPKKQRKPSALHIRIKGASQTSNGKPKNGTMLPPLTFKPATFAKNLNVGLKVNGRDLLNEARSMFRGLSRNLSLSEIVAGRRQEADIALVIEQLRGDVEDDLSTAYGTNWGKRVDDALTALEETPLAAEPHQLVIASLRISVAFDVEPVLRDGLGAFRVSASGPEILKSSAKPIHAKTRQRSSR